MYRQFVRQCPSFRYLFRTLWSRIHHSHPWGDRLQIGTRHLDASHKPTCSWYSHDGPGNENHIRPDKDILLDFGTWASYSWLLAYRTNRELDNPSSRGTWFSRQHLSSLRHSGVFLMVRGSEGLGFQQRILNSRIRAHHATEWCLPRYFLEGKLLIAHSHPCA